MALDVQPIAQNSTQSYQIATHGWSQNSNIDLFEMVQNYLDFGLEYILCTDISRDGMLTSPNFDLYSDLKTQFPALKIIASGGVSCQQDLDTLSFLNVYGCVVGKAIYENKIQL